MNFSCYLVCVALNKFASKNPDLAKRENKLIVNLIRIHSECDIIGLLVIIRPSLSAPKASEDRIAQSHLLEAKLKLNRSTQRQILLAPQAEV